MAADEDGYKILSKFYQRPLTVQEMQELGIDIRTLENLLDRGLLKNIDKTGYTPIYKLTKEGKNYVEEQSWERFGKI